MLNKIAISVLYINYRWFYCHRKKTTSTFDWINWLSDLTMLQ